MAEYPNQHTFVYGPQTMNQSQFVPAPTIVQQGVPTMAPPTRPVEQRRQLPKFDPKTVGLAAGFTAIAVLLVGAIFLITSSDSDDVAVQEQVVPLPDVQVGPDVPLAEVPPTEADPLVAAPSLSNPVPPQYVATGELPVRSEMAARATAFDNVDMQQFSMADMPLGPGQNSWLQHGAAAPVGRAGIGQRLTKVANFRTWCSFSHFSYNDPVVFPGQEGVAHLHMFMGNTLADHNSTGDSLQNSGGSSCDGGPLNRTSYWVPALLDGNGNAIIPQFNFIYYKSFDMGNATPAIEEAEAFPTGLRFLSTAKSTQPNQEDHNIDFWCGPVTNNMTSKAPHYQTIPDSCREGQLGMRVRFPFCWNGELESSDQFTNDHMVFPIGDFGGSVCPETHQRRIPHIEYQLIFTIPGGSDLSKWHLSSDVNPTTGEVAEGGSTLHGDWFNGWNQTVNEMMNQACHRALGECHQGIVDSDGTSLRRHGQPYRGGNNVMPLSELTKLCPGDEDNNSVDISYCSSALD